MICDREDTIAYFVGELNPSRAKTGFPLLTPGKLADMLAQIPTETICQLRADIEQAIKRGENPSRIFWRTVRA